MKTLNSNKGHHRYAGTCRHCGHKEEWVVQKHTMAQNRFQCSVEEQAFPCFINYCEDCKNMAVFELTAFSLEKESND